MHIGKTHMSVLMALLAALLFGINTPLSKLLLAENSPMFMVAFLYLGAGVGVFLMGLFTKEKKEAPLGRADVVWTGMMILLDVLAPFLLMWGLSLTTSANASLLFNFEMVATSLIALTLFHEEIGKRMWFSVGIITIASMLISVDLTDLSAFRFSSGSLLVMGACTCWGLENNCTRKISEKSTTQIVMVKGLGSGLSALAIAFLTHNPIPDKLSYVLYAMVLGFVAYGLSIFVYVKAQRELGAARTSAYYAAAPFIGVVLSFLILREIPNSMFGVGAVLMIVGSYLAMSEKHAHLHRHEAVVHEHMHTHEDLHHGHVHEPPFVGAHSHFHPHATIAHEHPHTPDIHHRHSHSA